MAHEKPDIAEKVPKGKKVCPICHGKGTFGSVQGCNEERQCWMCRGAKYIAA